MKKIGQETRTCAAPNCDVTFKVNTTSLRKYCHSGHRQHKPDCNCCICKNKRHEPKSEEHKKKIGLSLIGKNKKPKPPGFGAIMSKRIDLFCSRRVPNTDYLGT